MSAMRTLSPPTSGALLLDWLLTALQPMNRTRVKELLRSGRVLVNGTAVTRHDHPIAPTDRIAVARDEPPVRQRDARRVAIVHEDDAVVVIDKPCGLLTVATDTEKSDTAFVRLRDELAARREGRPFVVHRLDRETSGLLMFARGPEIRDRLQSDWERVKKTYLAVVEGKPATEEGAIDNFLAEGRDLRVRAVPSAAPGAKRAASRFRVVSTRGGYSLVEVVLETGRKHQIRVHLAGLGCPVAGDRKYGARTDPVERLGLHAWRLEFVHPTSDRGLELESPLPAELQKVGG